MTKLLPTNEHTIDRVLRVVLGLGLLAVVFVGPKTPLGLLGLIPLATGLVGTCPLYAALGLSTAKARKR
jgi:cadmium resistance protein CadD (predicted permease)